MATYRVRGIEAITATMRELPKAMIDKSLRKAVTKAAAMVRDDARALAPTDTGLLRSDIIIAADKKPELEGMAARAVLFVKWKGRAGAPYWRYLEFGTAKMAARPFLRPAFESNAAKAIATIIDSVTTDLPAIIKAAGGSS